MPRIKVKQLETRTATAGIHLGKAKPPKFRRKLEPGEVLELPEGDELLEGLWDTGLVEITLDPPTRPLDFKDYNEARYTSPKFRSRGPDEDEIADKVRDKVAADLAGESVAEAPKAPRRSVASAVEAETERASVPPRRRSRRAEQSPDAEVST